MGSPLPDAVSFTGDDLWLSEFRVLPGDPSWHLARQTTQEATLVAFPRTAVAIRQESRTEVIADPTSAVVYSPGQVYRRRLISPAGDDCTIVAIDQSLLAEVVSDFDSDADRRTYRFPFVAASVARDDHLEIELIRRLVQLGADDTRDAIHERLYWILHRVVAKAYADSRPQVTSTSKSHLELADAVREQLGRDISGRMSLTDIATTVSISPFHLVRTFRSVTGFPIHAYRNELRLRSSLPLIADGVRLADVAQQVGFASHAHLTERFTSAYGITPSRWRKAGSKSSKNMKAGGGEPLVA